MQMTRICLDFLLELLLSQLSYYFFVRQCKVHTTVRKEKGENASTTAEYVVRTKKNL